MGENVRDYLLYLANKSLSFCLILPLICALGGAEPAGAETITYGYDAFGRLTESFRRDGPLGGLSTKITQDAADNRQGFVMQNVIRVLHVGEGLYSPDGRFWLVMQGDGNLVLYQVGGAALWATATFGSNYFSAFQADGNLVVYTAASVPVWASNTGGYWGSDLHLQNDGNMTIYNDAGALIWQTATCCH